MKIITAPMLFQRNTGREASVFLAGGISNCPNWQELLISHVKFAFEDKENLIILNPRRENFDVAKTSDSVKQIKWEHQMLEECGSLLFWFPKDTLCPITLYELGCYTDKKKNLVVGCDPEYKRLLDVQTQTELRRPDVKVHVGFDNFLAAVSKHLRAI